MKKTVSLVLSSGGSRGLAQIGVIAELERHGFNITSVAGSSIGAVIGGLYAMGKLEEYTQWVSTFNIRDIWGFMDFTLTKHGLLKGERVFDKMKTFIPDMNIEDMPIPFSAVATDIVNEKEVVFNRGSFYQAVRASVAIPALFTPIKFEDTILVDGGILNPVPIEHVTRKKGDLLVVVNLYGKTALNVCKVPVEQEEDMGNLNGFIRSLTMLITNGDKHSLGYYSLLSKSTSAMMHRIAELSIEKFKPDIVLSIPYDSANTFDFYKAKELIELGEKVTRKALSESEIIKSML